MRDGETAKKAYEASLIRVGYALEMSLFSEMEAKKENVPLPLQYFTGDQKDAIARYNMERVDDGLNVEVEYYGGLFPSMLGLERMTKRNPLLSKLRKTLGLVKQSRGNPGILVSQRTKI